MGNEASFCKCCAKNPVVVDMSGKRHTGKGAESDGEHEAAKAGGDDEEVKPLAAGSRGRRAGVAAQSVDNKALADYKKPVYPKDDAARGRIQEVLRKNEKMQVLFGHVKEAGLRDVIDAFFAKTVRQGDTIIRQGEEGDCLYILDDGLVDVFVARAGEDPAGSRGKKVVQLGRGALFGELALMYSAPRAATVVAASSEVKLWALAQEPFKMLLAQSSQNTLQMYEGWLRDVDIFKSLNHYELSKLSELLESNLYTDGEDIITQGEKGDKFFLLEEGECAAFISGDHGEVQVKVYNKQGEFFGELALLTDEPRKATVRASEAGCSLVSVGKEDFDNLLGPIKDILKKHADQYQKYAEFLAE